MKLEFTRQIFERYSNIKFRGNPSSGNRVVPCGLTDMKLIVAFRNYGNAPKNALRSVGRQTTCQIRNLFVNSSTRRRFWTARFFVLHDGRLSNSALFRMCTVDCRHCQLTLKTAPGIKFSVRELRFKQCTPRMSWSRFLQPLVCVITAGMRRVVWW